MPFTTALQPALRQANRWTRRRCDVEHLNLGIIEQLLVAIADFANAMARRDSFRVHSLREAMATGLNPAFR